MRWGEEEMVICYHGNDDLHERIHEKTFLLQDGKKEDGKHVVYGQWKYIFSQNQQ